jgi:hypothetical protein
MDSKCRKDKDVCDMCESKSKKKIKRKMLERRFEEEKKKKVFSIY